MSPHLTIYLIALLVSGSSEPTEDGLLKLYRDGDIDQVSVLLPQLDDSAPVKLFINAVLNPDGDAAKQLFEQILEKHPDSRAAPLAAERLWAYHNVSGRPETATKYAVLLDKSYPGFKGVIDRSLPPPKRIITEDSKVSQRNVNSTKQWSVQVGAFRIRKGADATMKQVSKFGRAYCVERRNAKGPITLVRVGPFDSKAEAEQASDKINKSTDLKTVVIESND